MSAAPRRLRAVVVDDEPLARKRLLALLADEPDIDVVGEAGGGSAAVRLITAARPDLVFLDVQMPGLDGFEVLRAVAPSHLPLVVFVTAYDEHAIRAFEVAAVDYLLKPVAEARFREAVRRAVDRVAGSAAGPATGGGADDVPRQLAALLERLTPPAAAPERFAVRANGSVTFVRVQDIDWVDASDDQVRLHVGRETLLVRETMGQVEARLPAPRFVRIHRSTIVNFDRVREVQPWFKGDYLLILRDGTRLTSGRTYRERVQRLLT